jgi:acyl-CoA synthetase (AMP-forming)/AMP-acid ligase II
VNIMMLLEMAASGFGDRVAVGNREGGLTYQQLFDRAGAAADRFRSEPIEHVAMVDVASEALPISLFGAAWAGLPFVPINYRLADDELRALVARVSPGTVICDPAAESRVQGVDGVSTVTRPDYLADLAARAPAAPEWGMDAEDIAILLFTSGTTGVPKAAVLRHKHLVSYIFGSVEFMGAGEDEATLMSVPPYHIAGMAAILSSVYAGRRIVQLPNFSADEWVDIAIREEVTHAMVVPTMLARIVEVLAERNATIPSLRHLSYGGGKMPHPVIDEALYLLPHTNFVNAYGLTETSSTICLLGPEDHREAHRNDDPAVRQRLSSVGRPLPSIEVSIRDEQGNEVEPFETGEIWVRGEQVSGEYLGRGSQLNADGWFCTKDGGWMDGAGFLYISGRVDDIIIRGGENISPGEIEDVLMEHPAVADACAIGVPDAHWGERVVAAIVLHEGSDVTQEELQEFVKTYLRSSRTPEHFEFKAELPYNETGKLLRRVIREDLAHLGDGSTL